MDEWGKQICSEGNSHSVECVCVNEAADGFGNRGCNCIVPPWKLRVVSMGQQSEIESITIPDDADTRICTRRTGVKFVSCGRRGTIIVFEENGIGMGLPGDCPETSKTDSGIDIHCTEQIDRGKRHDPEVEKKPRKLFYASEDLLISEKDEQIRRLREEIVSGGRVGDTSILQSEHSDICPGEEGKTNKQASYQGFPKPVSVIMEKFQSASREHCILDEDFRWGTKTNESRANPEAHTGFTSDCEGGSDADPLDDNKLENSFENDTREIEFGMKAMSSKSQLLNDDVTLNRRLTSTSDRPLHIICGRPNQTRSG